MNYSQVERLARPAVNEGLLFSNSLLNTFNQVAPTVDLTTSATAVQNEALAVLGAIGNRSTGAAAPFANAGGDDRRSAIVTAFLPDVMRIDTTVVSGYAAAATLANGVTVNGQTVPRPMTGRLLTDDTIDVTLSVLVHPALQAAVLTNDDAGTAAVNEAAGLASDFVGYSRWHRNPSNTFPYLVPPN